MSGTGSQGGYDQGMPLTYNMMAPIPGLVEVSHQQAFAIGARTAARQRTGVEGYDFRNFRRGSALDRNRGVIK